MKKIYGIFLIFIFSRIFLISDIPFGNDDAQLFLKAIADREAGLFTTFGLLGSRGLDYGPFAIWCYQIFLFFTRDLLWISWFRSLLIALTTFGCLSQFKKLLPAIHSKYLYLSLLSPYLYNYGRDLWDNSLVIPLSGLAFCFYFVFMKKKHWAYLGWALFFAVLGVLTHLVFIPVLLSLLVHLILFYRPWIGKNKGAILFLAVLLLMVSSPYLFHLFQTIPQIQTGTAPYDLGHLFTPLLGARFYTVLGVEHFLGRKWFSLFDDPLKDYLWGGVISLSALAYLGMWVGIYQIKKESNEIKYLFWLALGFQMLMSLVFRLIPIPNFHSALWFVYLYFLIVGLEYFSKWKYFQWLYRGYLFSLFIGLIGMIWMVHRDGGSRWHHYGPTLGNYLEIMKELKEKRLEDRVVVEVEHLQKHPFIFPALKKLIQTPPGADWGSSKEAIIRYQFPEKERDSHLVLQF